MKKLIIIAIVIAIAIISISLSVSTDQNNESNNIQETPPLVSQEETKLGRNLEVYLEENVSMKSGP